MLNYRWSMKTKFYDTIKHSKNFYLVKGNEDLVKRNGLTKWLKNGRTSV